MCHDDFLDFPMLRAMNSNWLEVQSVPPAPPTPPRAPVLPAPAPRAPFAGVVLPGDWVEQEDPVSRRKYYYSASQQRTSWADPRYG